MSFSLLVIGQLRTTERDIIIYYTVRVQILHFGVFFYRNAGTSLADDDFIIYVNCVRSNYRKKNCDISVSLINIKDNIIIYRIYWSTTAVRGKSVVGSYFYSFGQ